MLMPERLRDLSHLTYDAQMMLVPRMLVPRKEGVTDDEAREIELPNNIGEDALPLWFAHFNMFSAIRPAGHTDLQINSTFSSYELPKAHGPSTVKSIHSSASQCVWYPASVNGLQAKQCLNPYVVDPSLTRQFYTEVLPLKLRELQWSVNHPCESSTESVRGNKVYAERHNMPKEFGIAAFEIIGSIRA